MGPNTVLTKEEEDVLVKWLMDLAKCGFPQRKQDLLNAVETIVTAEGRRTPFPLREVEGLSKARGIITKESILKWFRELKIYLEQCKASNILEDSSRIFNGDETSFAMCPKSGKVLAPKVFSADGKTLTPMVVFPFMRPNKAIIDSVPSGWFIGRSETGWMRSETFFEYIANGLNNWVTDNKTKRPILLLVDGLKSHLSIELSQFCDDNEIILYALPPNTTHIMQPADVSVFKPLKTYWKKTIRAWQAKPQNVNCVLTKSTFCPLLKEVFDDESLPQTIKNGFKKYGLFLFNPDAVDYSKCECTITEDQFETTETLISKLKDKLIEKGVEHIQNVIEQIKLIKEDYYPKEKLNEITNFTALPLTTYPDDIVVFDFEELEHNVFGYNNVTDDNETAKKIIILEDITILSAKQEDKINITPPVQNLENSDEFKGSEEGKIEYSQIKLIELKPNETEPSEVELNEIIRSEKDVTEETKSLYDITVLPTMQNKLIITALVQNELTEIETEFSETKIKTKSNDNEKNKEELQENWSDEKKVTMKKKVLEDIMVLPTMQNKVIVTALVHNELTENEKNVTEFSESKQIETKSNNNEKNKEELQENIPDEKKVSMEKICTTSNEKRKPKDKLPAAISSEEFRKQLQEKIDKKKQLEEEKKKRKEERIKRNTERKEQILKRKRIRENSLTPQLKRPSTLKKKKEACADCNLDLDSDTENNDERNIGCDKCPKWYHLKCTIFQGCAYSDIQNSEFICKYCSTT
ncbi:hypothetical protein NQ314_010278 [Rhamnusium bicolor]|uniref:PHD-type domain-containing protein n=1 Tax=Rhamnusium bicolor TaxID=1586634 RepID=A0AAV8XSX1_9CUCU|nr:hypothetical protein NQ314_010278 [Rhamnusium bicolor]